MTYPTHRTRSQTFAPYLAALVAMTTTTTAAAFCGFYVGGGDTSLFNDATQVVLMRNGNRTVTSMQNNYNGPVENFAMVIPVPVVLQEANVKTLSADLFAKIDQLTAPRLVEYWEMDPCEELYDEDNMEMAAGTAADSATDDADPGVTVEAQFQVGEYDIVILSTQDGTALDSWLTTNEYNIPDGFGTHVTPYVEEGMYFFVAKVNVDEVTMVDGRAVLSPLRFYFDSDSFSLPIKLGLLNAQETQDLVVYTLGVQQRYELANRPNVTIPTNIEVINEVRDDFGAFYRTLFAETVAQNPGAAITEYSWDASTCDPCPGPTLTGEDYQTLGADVLSGDIDPWAGWVVTRLHLRYDTDSIGDDLVFSEASPIVGGRENIAEDGELESGATAASYNNFQGRYIIRHRWDGTVSCDEPVYGRWGGPGGEDSVGATGSAQSPNTLGESSADSASTSGLPSNDLEDLVYESIPELNINPSSTPSSVRTDNPNTGCGCNTSSAGSGILLMMGMAALAYRRSRRRMALTR